MKSFKASDIKAFFSPFFPLPATDISFIFSKALSFSNEMEALPNPILPTLAQENKETNTQIFSGCLSRAYSRKYPFLVVATV